MKRFRKTSAWLTALVLSVAPYGARSAPQAPQEEAPCLASKIVEQSCSDLGWVNVERDKPFLAERTVTTTKSSVQSSRETELVARDPTGRVRTESHIHRSGPVPHPNLALGGVPSSHGDLNTDMSFVETNLTVDILDCWGGKRFQLDPSTHSAVAAQSCASQPKFRPSDNPYSYKLTRLLSGANVEDLGFKQIQGMQARGIKIIWMGGEKDGDFQGKPARFLELWASDELGVTLLSVYSDLTNHVETRISLSNILRQEPDASLFTIPSGYKTRNWE
jgi:hypothetical protein